MFYPCFITLFKCVVLQSDPEGLNFSQLLSANYQSSAHQYLKGDFISHNRRGTEWLGTVTLSHQARQTAIEPSDRQPGISTEGADCQGADRMAGIFRACSVCTGVDRMTSNSGYERLVMALQLTAWLAFSGYVRTAQAMTAWPAFSGYVRHGMGLQCPASDSLS